MTDADSDIRELGEEEVVRLRTDLEARDRELQRLLLPRDPRDERNVFLEIRAGTGGDEAAIFVGDLLRMYGRYAESQGWQVELLSDSPGEHGGYREVICRIVGRGVFSKLKFESGTHRVQRVPATEAQGRIHTSTVTVAIRIETGYPNTQLNMVYFYPALARVDGKPIGATEAQQPLDGKIYQRWSRHRTAENPWKIGRDHIGTHVILIEDWRDRELEKCPCP